MQKYLSEQLEKIVLAQCEDTNTPRALTVALLMRAREYGQLFTLKIDPNHYADPTSFFKDNCVTELLRKVELDTHFFNRSDIATKNFYSSEAQCYRSNRRLHRYSDQGYLRDVRDLRLREFFLSVRKSIDELLGPIPRELEPKFGPGGTFADRGPLVTVPDKMSSRSTITACARALLPLWGETAWARALVQEFPTSSDPLTVRGNRFTTVPKDATKDRGICIEPSINVYYQLGVAKHLRAALLKTGIDLDYGQDLHKVIAQKASKSGDYATIDLSNASDTVSVAIVQLCLPPRWYDLLNLLRSPYTFIENRWVRLEKFSSMGNGYTFELETLIFSQLAKAVSENLGNPASLGKGVWVYGDDIIVPTTIAPTVLDVLNFCGFTQNPRKTFLSGKFRESCGGDYFDGVPVRAHYQKVDPYEPQHFIALANGIRRVVQNHSKDPVHWRHYKRSWFKCLDALPSSIRRLRGPVETGDLTIHDDQWDIHMFEPGKGRVRAYLPVSRTLKWHHWKPGVVLASALYGVDSNGVSPRDNVDGYRVGWVSVFDRPPGHDAAKHSG